MVEVNLSIDVPDLELGVRFYSRSFGFSESARPFPEMAVLDAENMIICIHQKQPDTTPAPGSSDVRTYSRHWTPVHADFHAADFDAALARAQENGAKLENLFRTHGRPSVAFCSDPFGNGFCIIEKRNAGGG